MGKKIFHVYLAKEGVPNNEAYAKLDLPASPWELWDALDKVRLNEGEQLYMEIDDYYAFEYLAPHLEELDISLNELNDLAALLSVLDEVQEVAFEGLFSIEVQRKVNANGGVITLQDLRDLAVSAKTDCYHVVDAADDAQLGRFYAENEFIPELDGVSNEIFEMLDFAGIGRMMRCSENGVFVNSLYVLRDGELTTAPPVQKALPGKPGYLFRLTLGLHPDIGDARTVTLDLPAAEAELLDAQEQLGTLNWENTVVLNYDGILPNAAVFADLPSELEELNAFTKAARDLPRFEVPKLKALLEQFEVQDIETALFLTEHLADYILTPEISSPQETAINHLRF
ncbi:antirestriction protein ArdA, partial [Dysosmobacter sp.]|uniref:antirestriction protein ArdA n=1 Tax=Dysosmobacter sp. TaxID=2591382 RepID=UPI003AB84A78